MKLNAKVVWTAIGVVVVGLLIAAISIPNLLRSRIAANEAARVARMNSALTPPADELNKAGILMSVAQSDQAGKGNEAYYASHKVIRTATLDLVAKDVTQAMEQIRRETTELGGYVEKASLSHEGDNLYGAITVRVPQVRLEQAIAGFKQTAIRVQSENLESTDVTKQFVDTESQLRNFRAEEQQYLTIMRTATKVQDTLDIAEKLTNVRGRIESLQGELNYLSHQVEMSSVTMNVRPQITAVAAAFEWHPIANARTAFRDLVSGLADFVDFLIAVLIKLPLVLLWIAFIVAVVFYGWRVGKWGFGKLKGSLPVTTETTQQ